MGWVRKEPEREITVAELREIIRQMISVELAPQDALHSVDEEIDEFISINEAFDSDMAVELLDPGLLGYQSRTLVVDDIWMRDFVDRIRKGLNDPVWLAVHGRFLLTPPNLKPEKTVLWKPSVLPRPSWIETSPTILLLARELIEKGASLASLSSRDFEKLIGELLERDGWKVTITRASKDGGIDVEATKDDFDLGSIRAIWQAKKYGPGTKVGLHHVKELAATLDKLRATKAVMVTTSRLTRGAMDWVKADTYRLAYKQGEDIHKWIRQVA